MATPRAMLRSLRPSYRLKPFQCPSRRNFIDVTGTQSQTLVETRILPYNSSSLYSIISDVDSYSDFLPYCNASKVTAWSSPDTNDQRWPSQADLTVGWSQYTETFTSKLFCIPGSVIEAQSGSDALRTTLTKSSIEHHGSSIDSPPVDNSVFESLLTRWTVKPFHYMPPTGQPQTDKTKHPPREQTEVHLSIEYKFKNPMYGLLTRAVTPKVAAAMVDAFERRARTMLDGPGAAVKKETMAQALGRKMGA